MSFLSLQNKNLIVRPGVVLTETIDPAIVALDLRFAGRKGYVTSGLRTKEQQLEIIKQYAKLKGVVREFPAILTATLEAKTFFHDKAVYVWQPTWSRLLERGVIINPPIAAAPLFNYVRNGENLKGVTIMPSPHLRGVAFDIGGGVNGVEDEWLIVTHALEDIPEIRSVVLERENNCVHVNCVSV